MKLNIGIGEIRKFNLKAPSGEYDVIVGDGENSINQMVLLTGNAISIKDFKKDGRISRYYLLWGFLIFILAAISFILLRRYRRTKTISLGNWNLKEKIKHCGLKIGMIKDRLFSGAKMTDRIKSNAEKKTKKDFGEFKFE